MYKKDSSQFRYDSLINERLAQQPQMNISLEQLAKYNGKNRNPAYVAVDGIVYDVTDNAAWGAATHFGLTVGKDLTEQYKSYHAGQQILSNLKKIGKII